MHIKDAGNRFGGPTLSDADQRTSNRSGTAGIECAWAISDRSERSIDELARVETVAIAAFDNGTIWQRYLPLRRGR